jgi:hypothetical protein
LALTIAREEWLTTNRSTFNSIDSRLWCKAMVKVSRAAEGRDVRISRRIADRD